MPRSTNDAVKWNNKQNRAGQYSEMVQEVQSIGKMPCGLVNSMMKKNMRCIQNIVRTQSDRGMAQYINISQNKPIQSSQTHHYGTAMQLHDLRPASGSRQDVDQQDNQEVPKTIKGGLQG